MASLRNRLPPTNALVTFEAVARQLSFTAAARELGVSQAATSRQVRILEDHLGVTLFDRAGRRVRLTAAGEQLQQAATMAFGHIAATAEGLRRERRGSALTVATSIAFSSLWLMPRLAAFHARCPDLELRLITSDSEADWRAEEVDIAVIFGRREQRGSAARRLFGDQVVAVAAASYFESRPRPACAAELTAETLLHIDSPHGSWLSWQDWFQACGLAPPTKLSGPHFNNYAISIQAARAGRGVALGWRRLIADELAEGRLEQVCPEVIVPDGHYFLTVRQDRGQTGGIGAFRDWILAEAAKDWV